ncbi:MAG: hypothetical protein HC922_01150 [Leptolyngbyaceae cyanobacterium SM2_3_12]|nr:hypothetical protein [Leptolyngbyaceae cyanobacterium SM2_3_12]
MPTSSTRSSNIRQGLDVLVIVIGIGLIVGLLLLAIGNAFYDGLWPGLRSLAASLFPLIVTLYLGFLIRLRRPEGESQAPRVNNFVLFTLWTMVVMGIARYTIFLQFPLAELLYSLTLSGLILRSHRRKALKDLAACCYGIICGWLGALVLFG